MCADTLWHIKVGQIILDAGEILTHDIFSHTVTNKPWTAHEWLSEVFMAWSYNLGGFPGLSLFFFTSASFTLLLLFKAAQKASNEWSAFIAVSIAAAFSQSHLLIRPHVFSWLLGALTLYLLMNQSRWLWVLPPLTALWSNLHGGVLLGLVLQGGFLTGAFFDGLSKQPIRNWHHHWKTIRQPFWVFTLSLLALGCNPFGYSLLWFPFHVSAEIFSKHISEWKSPDMQVMWHFRFWLVMMGILLAAYGKKTTWTWRLLLIFLVYQALGHIRHVSVAVLFLSPWMAMAFKEVLSNIHRDNRDTKAELSTSAISGPVLTIISLLLLFNISILQPAWWKDFTQSRFSLTEEYSQGAVSYLTKNGYPGDHLLNDYSWGGYLIFSMAQPPKVFIDGRADMYGEKVFSDYAKLTYIHPDTDDLLKKYKIDWVLYPSNSFLIQYLKNKPEWRQLYSDEFVSILSLKQKISK